MLTTLSILSSTQGRLYTDRSPADLDQDLPVVEQASGRRPVLKVLLTYLHLAIDAVAARSPTTRVNP